MSRALSLAGFQVTLIGRFWVIPEGMLVHHGSGYEVSMDDVECFILGDDGCDSAGLSGNLLSGE